MPLILTLHVSTTLPIEVEGILPERCRNKSLAEIEQLPIFHGKERMPLGSMFRVQGAGDDQEMVFQGDCRGVHWIGAKMTSGKIRVLGNAGRHVGSQMTQGELVIEGYTGDWLGAEMRGGKILAKGNAGHQVGAAYRGSSRGMRGGEILIHGDAGNEIGARMRRGLIAVAGKSGDAPGYAMLAGSILLMGEMGKRPGGNMKRGTMIAFQERPPEILPTFHRAGRLRPSFLGLLLRHLLREGFPVASQHLRAEFDLYSGDHLEGGRGELLISN